MKVLIDGYNVMAFVGLFGAVRQGRIVMGQARQNFLEMVGRNPAIFQKNEEVIVVFDCSETATAEPTFEESRIIEIGPADTFGLRLSKVMGLEGDFSKSHKLKVVFALDADEYILEQIEKVEPVVVIVTQDKGLSRKAKWLGRWLGKRSGKYVEVNDPSAYFQVDSKPI